MVGMVEMGLMGKLGTGATRETKTASRLPTEERRG
jgi:hypothetical protein